MFLPLGFLTCVIRAQINITLFLLMFFSIMFRGVQNRTNLIEKPQTEPTQTAKNRIWFACIQIIFLLNRMVCFGLRFLFYQPNQSKPNCNIRKNTN